MSYRHIYLGLGLVAVAAIAFGIAFATEGDEILLPGPVESVAPEPGHLVPPQTSIEIDLEVGYVAQIYVDNWLVSDATFVEGTGVYRWTPSPTNPTISEWTSGEHTIRVVYDTVNGLPDPGDYSWTFRVG
ncbi:MAG: hypothetical protein M3P87_04895 [Actinomycetota bacterium]|nr:hypothetical protein [Actinomycetota bacterium]